MRGSCWVAMALSLVVMSFGCAAKPDPFKQMMLDRVKVLESMQENSQRARERLERENSRLTERLDKLNMDLVNLALELERLLTPPVIESVTQEVDEVVVVPAAVEDKGTVVEVAATEEPRVVVEKGPVRAVTDGHAQSKSTKKDNGAQVSARDVYKKALDLLFAHKAVKARKLFVDFIEDYPKSSLLPNAHYWLGETYFDQHKFVEAILAFKDVPDLFPKHHKAPDALLKIVSCYMWLDDEQNATFYLGLLLKGYPNARATKLARKRYAKLM